MIDTGSHKSFINPKLAYQYFPEKIKFDPFQVKSVHQISSHEHTATIPAPTLFNAPSKVQIKFHLFNFHEKFDGLLGLELIKQLNAQLDFKNSKLITPSAQIPIHYENTQSGTLYSIEVEARVQKVVKIPVSKDNGPIIIPYQKINNVEIPQSTSIARNNFALTTMTNSSSQNLKITLKGPVVVETLEAESIETYNLNSPTRELSSNPSLDISKLRLQHLNDEEKCEIMKLCTEYSDIFYDEEKALSFTNQVKHQIKTTDEVPMYTKTYRYPSIHRQEVQNQIQKMLDQKIIQPSNSPWSSPIWVVPKKLDASGKTKWRVVIDYRKLNEKTIDDKYPLPNITDLLDKLGRCQYFTTLDLASGFHQIEMHENDIPKTAFNVENGHYEFRRMPFGLKNAPATFQRLMDNILRGVQNESCLVYLDDIIVFSTSLEEHISRLKGVFDRLRNSNFKIQLEKSEFLKKEVAYLGHIVTPDGVKPNPDKITAIQNYPIPTTQTEIKRFLGLLGYYRRFIQNFAHLTKPLTKCLKKGKKVIHDDDFVKSFETCKSVLSNEPILQYPDFSRPFILTTDASNVALGAVLSQGKIGEDLPVAFASRTLNDSERNYSTIEKELLAIVWATKYFRPYLYGRKFTIMCDHKPLQWIFSLKEPNSKLTRWRLRLEEFDYEIHYKKGKCNANADALSRIELNAIDGNEEIDQTLDDQLENESLIVNTGERNEKMKNIIQEIESQADQSLGTVHTNIEDPVVGIPIADQIINKCTNQIYISLVNYLPAKPKFRKIFDNTKLVYTVQISKTNFENDVVRFVKTHLAEKVPYHLYFEEPEIYPQFSEVIRKNFKWPQLKLVRCTLKRENVFTDEERFEIIKLHHEGKANHRGIEETHHRIGLRYYWPNMKNSITTFINQCNNCCLSKYDRKPIKTYMNVTPTPSKPLEVIHIDTYSIERTKFLTIIDSFSKFAQAYYMSSANVIEVLDNLLDFFSHHGTPNLITTDNGPEFHNATFEEFLKLHKIEIHFTSVQHPNSNGMIERLHSTLTEQIRLLNNQQTFKNMSTPRKMKYAINAYNNTIHSTTKLTPLQIISGHLENKDVFDIDLDARLANDYVQNHKDATKIIYSNLNEKMSNNKEKIIAKLNENREPNPITVDQEIFPKKMAGREIKARNRYYPKVKAIEIARNTVQIRDIRNPNKLKKIHMDNVKRPTKQPYNFNPTDNDN